MSGDESCGNGKRLSPSSFPLGLGGRTLVRFSTIDTA